MIRPCRADDFETMLEIVNDAAQAYRGVIPADCWHDPYMPRGQLAAEIAAGVAFQGIEEDGRLAGIMGLQERSEVTLIRHAYVRTASRGRGLGARLLREVESLAAHPILIGTWRDADWAIRFYVRHGYRVLDRTETRRQLAAWWQVPPRQADTSVVLAAAGWSGPAAA